MTDNEDLEQLLKRGRIEPKETDLEDKLKRKKEKPTNNEQKEIISTSKINPEFLVNFYNCNINEIKIKVGDYSFKYYDEIKKSVDEINVNEISHEDFENTINDLLKNNTNYKINSRELLGQYISALINSRDDNNFVFKLEQPINFFGMYNNKNLIVDGDLGDYSFFNNLDGEIVVNGNSGENSASEFENGSIVYNGTVGEHSLFKVKGGKIEVNGDFIGDCCLAISVEDGSITINGKANGCIGSLQKGGEIYLLKNVNGHIGDAKTGGKIIAKEDVHAGVGAMMEGGIIICEKNVYGRIGLNMTGGEIYVNGKAHEKIITKNILDGLNETK